MPRETEPIGINEHGDETHPAFAIVTLHKINSTGTPLFQSDLMHHRFIRVELHEATRKRDLKHDWTHPGKTIASFDMSFAQWGAFISSAGDGSGTPATLNFREQVGTVPDIPYQPRIAQSIDETKAAVDELLTDVREAFQALDEAEERKAGIKERRELRHRLKSAIFNARSNAAFAVRSMAEAAEKTVQSAKADIEVVIAQAMAQHGVEPTVALPDVIELHAIEASPSDHEDLG